MTTTEATDPPLPPLPPAPACPPWCQGKSVHDYKGTAGGWDDFTGGGVAIIDHKRIIFELRDLWVEVAQTEYGAEYDKDPSVVVPAPRGAFVWVGGEPLDTAEARLFAARIVEACDLADEINGSRS